MGISLDFSPVFSPKLLAIMDLAGSVGMAGNEWMSTHSESDQLWTGLLAGGLSAGVVGAASAYQAQRDGRTQIDGLQAKIQRLSADKVRLSSEIETLKQQLQVMQTEAQAMADATSQLELETIKKLAAARQAVTLKASQLTAAQTEVKTVQGELVEAQQSGDALRNRVLEWERCFEERLEDKTEDLEIEFTQRVETLEGEYRQKKLQLERDIKQRADKAIERRLDNLVGKRHNQRIVELQTSLEERETMLRVTAQELERAKLAIARFEQESLGFDAQREQEFDAYEQAVETRDQRIEEQRLTIISLNRQLSDLRKPRLFPAKQTSFPGNYLIKVACESQGVILDAAYRALSPGKQTYYFNYRGEGNPSHAIQPLNGHLTAIKEHLALLDITPFKYNTEKLLVECTLTTQVKVLTDSDVDRYWTPRSQFKGLCKDFNRVRITGASEGAKSPLARNILGAKLLSGEKFIVRRMDPSAGSRKDYWRIAPEWTDYQDAKTIAREINQTIQRRKTHQEAIDLSVYFVLDEVDNTMTNIADSDRKAYATAIKNILKEGSHLNIGCIVSGQNPNVSTYPGFQRGDFNNAVNIHIGNNIPDALANSNNQFGVTKMGEAFKLLSDYVETRNRSIQEEAKKYRFAMVEMGQKQRFMIELPLLGQFGFDEAYGGDEYEFESFSTADYADAIRSLDDALLSGIRIKNSSFPPGILRSPQPASERIPPDALNIADSPDPHHRNGFSDASQIASSPASDSYVGLRCIKCETGTFVRRKQNRGNYLYQCDACEKWTSGLRIAEALRDRK